MPEQEAISKIALMQSSPKVRAHLAGTAWFDFDASISATDPEARNGARLLDSLKSILLAERLVVLAGLGTSLSLQKSVTNAAGTDSLVSAGAPTMAKLLEAVSALDGFEAISRLFPDSVTNVEQLLSACQFKLALGEDASVQVFLDEAEKVILKLCSFVDEQTELTAHEVFLRKIARRQTRLSRTQIFTTNYDLAFERAASRVNFNVIDGFGLGAQRAFDGNAFDLDIVRRRFGETMTLEPNVFQLLKLHGSVDWDDTASGVVRESNPSVPVLIYPSQNKYQMSFRPPYLELMSRFQMALRQPDVAVVVLGFGFNDAHIVGPIEAAIRSNVGLRIVVVAPRLEVNTSATVSRLESLIAAGDRRITLVQTTFDAFASLLPDTSPQDEREIHEARTNAAWDR